MAKALPQASSMEAYIVKEQLPRMEQLAETMGLLLTSQPVPGTKTKVMVCCWGNQLPLQTLLAEVHNMQAKAQEAQTQP